ncbi:MAG TPA: hypothetical protein VNG33_09355 [Polyangiaceae bacterium]|nr:hypothetical protein [Polyangiaceae bacterium]
MSELVLRKYLERYAEPEVAWGRELHTQYAGVVVVPLQREDESFLDNLAPALAAAAGRVLVVAVVNATDEAPAATHDVNARLLRLLSERLPMPGRQELSALPGSAASAILGRASPAFDLLLIDRASPGKRLPVGEGVGLARRIGMDVALQLHQLDGVTSAWLATTDADAQPPVSYFRAMAAVEPLAPDGTRRVALTLPFWHSPSGEAAIDAATALYELSLRYYTLGLAAAGSPYAYQSMGSSIAVLPAAYAEVRGFPRRNAGEDFYLLDKLAKVGTLHRPATEPILLRSRTSDRVPFGTGKKVSEVVANGGSLSTYHPRVFELLRVTLAALRHAVVTADVSGLAKKLTEAFDSGTSGAVSSALEELQTFDALRDTLDASHDARVRERRLLTWFDALRTLRFIHLLERPAALERLPVLEALGRAPFCEFWEPAMNENTSRMPTFSAEQKRPSDVGVESAILAAVNGP